MSYLKDLHHNLCLVTENLAPTFFAVFCNLQVFPFSFLAIFIPNSCSVVTS